MTLCTDLQQSRANRETDSQMASAGEECGGVWVCTIFLCLQFFLTRYYKVGRGWWSCDLLLISCDYRGYAWQHTQSRALCQLPETLYGVPKGVSIQPSMVQRSSSRPLLIESTKSHSCSVRVSALLPTTHTTNCLHREEAIKVRLCEGGSVCAKVMRLWGVTTHTQVLL